MSKMTAKTGKRCICSKVALEVTIGLGVYSRSMQAKSYFAAHRTAPPAKPWRQFLPARSWLRLSRRFPTGSSNTRGA